MLILSNDDVEQLLTMKDCLAVLEEVYRDFGEGKAISGPRCDILTPGPREGTYHGFKTMSGSAPCQGVTAVRITSDLIHWPTEAGVTRRVKIPKAGGNKYVGLVELFSIENGEPLAIFPDGVMQRVRVGAANGLGAKYLAWPDAGVVGLLGSGWQAGAQLIALCEVRKIDKIKVFSPNPEKRNKFCAEMSELLNVQVRPVHSAEEAVRDSDIVHCATNAVEPVMKGEWVGEGAHLGCIRHCELDAASYQRSSVVFLHTKRQIDPIHDVIGGGIEKIPELAKGWNHPEMQRAGVAWNSLPDVGDLLTGKAKGRSSAKEITCFVNNIGMGMQFAAVGGYVYKRALAKGIGKEIPTEWFLQTVHP